MSGNFDSIFRYMLLFVEPRRQVMVLFLHHSILRLSILFISLTCAIIFTDQFKLHVILESTEQYSYEGIVYRYYGS